MSVRWGGNADKKNGGGALAPPPGVREGRYGRLTVVESPEVEIVKVPDAVDVYPYAAQPAGGAGVEAMNGPAV